MQPFARILFQAPAQQAFHGCWRVRRQRAPVRLAHQNRRERFRHVPTGERAAAGEHLLEHASERPDAAPPAGAKGGLDLVRTQAVPAASVMS